MPPAASRSPRRLQIFHQRDRIDGLLLLAELHHALEDVPVLRQKEILRAQDLDGGIERVIVEQDRAENAAFGFEVLRERAFEGGIAGH